MVNDNKEFYNKMRRLAERVASEQEFIRAQREMFKDANKSAPLLTRDEALSNNIHEFMQQKESVPMVNPIASLDPVVAAQVGPGLEQVFAQSVALALHFLQTGQINQTQANQTAQALGNTFASVAPIHRQANVVAEQHSTGNLPRMVQQEPMHQQFRDIIQEHFPAPRPQASAADSNDLATYYQIGIMMTFGRELYAINNAINSISQGQTDLFRALINGPFNQLSIDLANASEIRLSGHPNQLNNEVGRIQLSFNNFARRREQDDDEEQLKVKYT